MEAILLAAIAVIAIIQSIRVIKLRDQLMKAEKAIRKRKNERNIH